MAKVKLGPIVTDIRGKTKEVLWTRTGESGIGAKSQAGIRSNPQSSLQAQVRSCVTLASRAWNDSLTETQRNAWNELAQSFSSETGELGNVRNLIPQTRGILSGFNLFLALYVPVCRCNIPITSAFYDPPLGLTSPSAITNLLASWGIPLTPNFALDFDGVDEYVNVGDVLAYEYNEPQSWDFWVKPLGDLFVEFLAAKYSTPLTQGYYFFIDSARIRWQISRLLGAEAIGAIRAFPGTGVWKHVTLTYDGSNIWQGFKIYVNSVVGQGPSAIVPLTGTIKVPTPLLFASNTTLPINLLTGQLDCIRNYNRVLTQLDVNILFNGGAGLYGADPFGDGTCQGAWMFCTGSGITLVDISGNNYDGTLINMEPGDWVPGKVPCVITLPGIDLTWTDPVTVVTGSKIRFWIRSQELGVHKQLVACVDLETESLELFQVRMSQGVLHDITDFPGHYLIQADVIQPNGLKSPPSNTVEVVVP